MKLKTFFYLQRWYLINVANKLIGCLDYRVVIVITTSVKRLEVALAVVFYSSNDTSYCIITLVIYTNKVVDQLLLNWPHYVMIFYR